MKFAILLKSSLLFNSFFCKQTFTTKQLQSQNGYECKNVSVICVEAIIYCYYIICMIIDREYALNMYTLWFKPLWKLLLLKFSVFIKKQLP